MSRGRALLPRPPGRSSSGAPSRWPIRQRPGRCQRSSSAATSLTRRSASLITEMIAPSRSPARLSPPFAATAAAASAAAQSSACCLAGRLTLATVGFQDELAARADRVGPSCEAGGEACCGTGLGEPGGGQAPSSASSLRASERPWSSAGRPDSCVLEAAQAGGVSPFRLGTDRLGRGRYRGARQCWHSLPRPCCCRRVCLCDLAARGFGHGHRPGCVW